MKTIQTVVLNKKAWDLKTLKRMIKYCKYHSIPYRIV